MVASIDQPIGEDGASVRDVLPAQAGDSVAELERETTRELLEGLTEEEVAGMDDVELARLCCRRDAAVDIQGNRGLT